MATGFVQSKFPPRIDVPPDQGRDPQCRTFRILSSEAEINARYEIEMGQCGVLLLCHTLHEAVRRDLATLFLNNCHGGIIAFVMHPSRQEPSQQANLALLDPGFSQ